MSQPIVIRLTVTLVSDDYNQYEPLIFRGWLPLQPDDALVAKEGDLTVRIWIDAACLQHELKPEEISHHGNINVAKAYVDVSGIDVPDDLARLAIAFSTEMNWIPDHIEATYDVRLVEEHSDLCQRVYAAAIKHFNRFIAYIRAVKGQCWLQEYRPDPHNLHSEFTRLRGKIQIAASDWLRLTCAGGIQVTAGPGRVANFIRQEDWTGVRMHLAGQRAAPLVGLLLTASDEFRILGHRRAALTEAVSALEVAVNDFARRVTPEKWSEMFGGRTRAKSFSSHVNRLRTSCTISYLFPVLFSDEQIPTDVLKKCQDAIEDRNGVIHHGTRDIDARKLEEYLEAIRALCTRLDRLRAESA